MRFLYSLIMYLLAPAAFAYFALRGLRDRRYWRGWSERLGLGAAKAPPGVVWIHASSVGEINAAAPLVRALMRAQPDQPLLITSVTATGAERAQELFGGRAACALLPLDLPGAVARFYRRHRPRLVVVMETEVWPNVFHHARRGGTPLVIANARMSDQSLRAYRRWPALIRPALRGVSAVLAQSGADAARFEDSGADPAAVRVTGNLKFDLELPEDSAEKGAMLRAAWGTERPVVTAGSTHEADESALLAAFGRLLDAFPDALLVLAPRHPERFARAAQKVRDAGLHLQRLGTGNQVGRDIQCLLIDAMGELLPYYGAADVAFVGGSIARIGGHNVLEPAAFGKPVLFGPHTDGNREVCEQLVEAGGALRVRNAHDLAAAMERLLADAGEREQMGRAAARLVNNGRGALETSLRVIEELLAGTASEGTRAG